MSSASAIDRLLEAADAALRAEDMREVERLGRELIDVCEATGDPRIAHGHLYLGTARWRWNDARAARTNCQRALDLFSEAGDRVGMLRATFALSAIAGELELDAALSHRLALEALLQARDLGDEWHLAAALGNFAEVCRQEGDYANAIKHATESAALYEKTGRFGRAAAQYGVIAQVHVLLRDYDQAIDDLDEAWRLLQPELIPRFCAWYFEVWFTIAVALDQYETAARLYGFVSHYRNETDTLRLPGVLTRISEPVERVFASFGPERAHDLVEEGELLTIASAQTLTHILRPPRG